MTRLVLVLFLMLMAAPPLRAEVVPDLMRGEAVVTGRDDLEERARGVRVALTQVLVKVCGNDRVVHHPDLPGYLAEAEAHVRSFEYAEPDAAGQVSDEEATRDRRYRLRVEFDPEAVHALLGRLGFNPWHEDRPRLLVLLAVNDSQGTYIVGTEADRGTAQRETLVLDARRRGLVLVVPKMDSAEATALHPREIAEAHGGAIGALATSYRADAVLAGTMTMRSHGYWDADWTLLADAIPVRWRVPGRSFDQAVAIGLGETARVLSVAQ